MNNNNLESAPSSAKYQHLFGPIPSRRFGISLGVDLVPFKTCTLDCIYCECGATTNLTLERQEFASTRAVESELEDYLTNHPPPDVITFSGAGEPTLALNIGEIIDFIKRHYPQLPVVVLTNGTLFSDPRVRNDIMQADIVVPSFDAATQACSNKINKPHAKLNLETIIQGLIAFRQEYANTFWLEIFLLPEVNINEEELSALKQIVDKINPDKIQLNTLDRPGVDNTLVKASSDQMQQIADYLGRSLVDVFNGRSTPDQAIRRRGTFSSKS